MEVGGMGQSMSFGQAIEAMKHGALVARAGWNGRGMWVRSATDDELDRLGAVWLPFLVMKTAGDQLVPWLASQTDMLATDWSVVRT